MRVPSALTLACVSCRSFGGNARLFLVLCCRQTIGFDLLFGFLGQAQRLEAHRLAATAARSSSISARIASARCSDDLKWLCARLRALGVPDMIFFR
jgi:hypothetical protein